MRWFRRAPKDPNACRIDEEWGGVFIGRRWCSTHEVKWDDGGRCPHEGEEPYQSEERRTESMDARPGETLTLRIGGRPHDFVILEVTHYGDRAIRIDLQDVESVKRRNTYQP